MNNNTKNTTMNVIRHLVTALLLGTASAQAATPIVIDNTDAGFSTTGTWPTSTVVPGFQGTNYQTHEANGSPPGAIVVDNTDPGFSATGTWPVSTAVGGYLGSNYQVHAANGEEPSAIVVDNLAGSFTGTWGVSTSVGGYYGTNYQAQAPGAGANTFTWTPTIPTTASYKVYARWTVHPNRSTHAVYTVNHAGGATAVTVNQEANGGSWQLLGTFSLNAGTGNTVVLADQGDGYVIADAIKVVPDGAPPSTATWTPTIPTAGNYKVYARWTAHPNRATDAKYTVTHAGGDTVVTADQEQNNGSWVLLGTFSMAPGSGHKVSLTDQANGYVIADAIRLLDAASPEFNTATWTPNAPAGQYEVYAKWTANANRATNATYTITHAQGTTQVPVNQQLNGSAFNLLGTFNLNGSSTITLTDQANGYVIADAIQLDPLTTVPKMYFVHTDHLNTPRLITSDTGQAVWNWANDDPYGNNAPNENPTGAGNFTCNLRLPGQYFDAELNTHYNYFRDYDPLTGRYIESDPIGLAGGINTYSYVGGNPVRFIDPEGLFCLTANQIKLISATAGSTVTGGIAGKSIFGAAAGAVIGFTSEIVAQQIPNTPSSLSAIGGTAGAIAGGGGRSSAVGFIAGSFTGLMQSQSNNEFQNTIAGGIGGLFGTFGAELLVNSKPYSWSGSPLFSAARGGLAGAAGGFTQDFLERVLQKYKCNGGRCE